MSKPLNRIRLKFDLLQIKYRTDGKKNFKNYTVVTDTPVYVTAVQSAVQLSDVSILLTA